MTERRRDGPDVRGLEEILGHRFGDRALLSAALRHSSMAGDGRGRPAQFDRLEFLGDRVVALVLADLLLERFPREPEGDLARRHAALVSRRTLAEIAAGIGLGRYLRLTRGEDESGGRTKPSVLADALEAVIGALYRDAGLAAAKALIVRLIGPRLDAAKEPPRDPKTALQEWAQGRGLPLPSYRTVRSEGPAHEPSFEIEVRVPGYEPATAGGSSKRDAERAAAAVLLSRISDGK